MYHRVAPLPPGAMVPFHYVAPKRFARHVSALDSLGFTAITLDHMEMAFRGEAEFPNRPIVFSFDDGYAHWSQTVVPVLAAKGWPGTLFFVSGLLGQHNKWDFDQGDVREGLMPPADVVAAAQAGMEIGGHSVTHARLTELGDEELWRELADCKSGLESVTSRELRYFCYPYGSVDQRVRDAAERAGYKGATTVAKGLNDSSTDRMLWRRINVRRDSSTPVLLWKLLRGRLRTTNH